MPTIIHINENLEVKGGVEVYISQLQLLLRERGWRSELVALSVYRGAVQIVSDNDELCWVGDLASFSLCGLSKVAQKKDVVFHVHSFSSPELLEKLFEIGPVVRTMHEPRMFCPGQGKFWLRTERVCEKPFGRHCLIRAYTEKCCNRHPKRLIPAYKNTKYEIEVASKKYSAVISNSRFIAKEAVASGIPSSKIELVHYFTPAEPLNVTARSSKSIVFVGRLSRTKGLHYLIKSMPYVLSDFPDVSLEVLGDGHDSDYFKSLVNELGLSSNVTFHGWCSKEKISQVLEQSSLAAFPSIYPEAFGIVGIEAMMQSIPVVAFDVGGISDWLRDRENGFFAQYKDELSLAEKVLTLLQDLSLNKRMGHAGRERALGEFSSEAHLDKLTKVYRSAIEELKTV